MTNPGNWPDPERPGVPMFPERDGWHVLQYYVVRNSKQILMGDPVLSWWNASRSMWKLKPEGQTFEQPERVADDTVKYHAPCLTPTQISKMLAGKYSVQVIQTALRVWDALDECDRTDADDMILLEKNGLMYGGIVEEGDDFEDLEIGEPVWHFTDAGTALVSAIRNPGAAP